MGAFRVEDRVSLLRQDLLLRCQEHLLALLFVETELALDVGEEHHILLVQLALGRHGVLDVVVVDRLADVATDLILLILGKANDSAEGIL